MKRELDIYAEPEVALDALLDEINKQKCITHDLQSEIRSIRSKEIRLNKTAEILKLENIKLKEDISSLEQKLRELEIELTLPESERTPINRHIDPFPKQAAYKKFNWAYVLVPAVVIAAVLAIRLNWLENTPSVSVPTVTNALAQTTTVNEQTTAVPQTNATSVAASNTAEEGYLVIENPLDPEGMVRVMDSYQQKARILAWVNPNDKFRIRTQSPQKMRRTYTMNGKNITVEDYFYKISDKEQWVFGYFTNKRVQ